MFVSKKNPIYIKRHLIRHFCGLRLLESTVHYFITAQNKEE